MTKEDAMKIEELHIKVTPLVEDAFYAFRDIDNSELKKRLDELSVSQIEEDELADRLMAKYLDDIDFSMNAMERVKACCDPQERLKAITAAYQMIENQKKYGFPCLEWWPD